MPRDQGIALDESAAGPRPMKAKPLLQALSWLGGVAAGGVFIALLTMTPSRVHGATRTMRIRWMERTKDTNALAGCHRRAEAPSATSGQQDGLTIAADSDVAPLNEP